MKFKSSFVDMDKRYHKNLQI